MLLVKTCSALSDYDFYWKVRWGIITGNRGICHLMRAGRRAAAADPHAYYAIHNLQQCIPVGIQLYIRVELFLEKYVAIEWGKFRFMRTDGFPDVGIGSSVVSVSSDAHLRPVWTCSLAITIIHTNFTLMRVEFNFNYFELWSSCLLRTEWTIKNNQREQQMVMRCILLPMIWWELLGGKDNWNLLVKQHKRYASRPFRLPVIMLPLDSNCISKHFLFEGRYEPRRLHQLDDFVQFHKYHSRNQWG